jgi:hypothetical protein
MFDACLPRNPPENLPENELEVAWKDWARKEELRRFDSRITSYAPKVLTRR